MGVNVVGFVEKELLGHRIEPVRLVRVEDLLGECPTEVCVVDPVEEVGGRVALLQYGADQGLPGVSGLLDHDRRVVGLLELLDDLRANVEAIVGHDDELSVLVFVTTCRREHYDEHDDARHPDSGCHGYLLPRYPGLRLCIAKTEEPPLSGTALEGSEGPRPFAGITQIRFSGSSLRVGTSQPGFPSSPRAYSVVPSV